jgi:hypothetical protein
MSKSRVILLFLIIFSLSLNEFYHEQYGRFFDYLALILIFPLIVIRNYKIKDLSLFFFFAPFIFFGLINNQILPSLAVLSGVIIIRLFYNEYTFLNIEFINVLEIVIAIHVAAFVIQIILFYVFKLPFSIIDLFPTLQASRTYNSGLDIIRPGGLMMEPNSYAANIFMLSFISYKLRKKLNTVVIIALISVPFTTSLWGIALFLILIYLYSSFRFKLVIGVLLFLALNYLIFFLEDSITYIRLLQILEDPMSDNSIVTRLGLNSDRQNIDILSLIFGHGINSTMFQDFGGGNGYSYMVYCFGIIGTLALLLWFYFSNGLKMLILFLLFNFTFPYFSYLIFWLFMSSALSNFNVVFKENFGND